MILDSFDLELVHEIAALRAELRKEPSRTANLTQWRASQDLHRQRLTALERQLIYRTLQSAISFDGVSDYQAGFPLLHFTDHAPQSPSYGASFVIGAQEGLTMMSISALRDETRQKFADAAAKKGAQP